MTDPAETHPADRDAAEAFDAMRRELSLLHHAIEGLTAARDNIPDYSVTLGQMSQALSGIGQRLKQIGESPAVSLTPAILTREINKAAQDVRAEDRQALREARDALLRSLGQVDGMVKRGQSADRQRDLIIWSAVGAFVLGILLWSFLPGAIARSLPQSWHVPEWMAARTMGVDQQAAGERLIETARGNGRHP